MVFMIFDAFLGVFCSSDSWGASFPIDTQTGENLADSTIRESREKYFF